LDHAWSGSRGVDAVVAGLVLAASRPSVSAPTDDRTDPSPIPNLERAAAVVARSLFPFRRRAAGDRVGDNALVRKGPDQRRAALPDSPRSERSGPARLLPPSPARPPIAGGFSVLAFVPNPPSLSASSPYAPHAMHGALVRPGGRQPAGPCRSARRRPGRCCSPFDRR